MADHRVPSSSLDDDVSSEPTRTIVNASQAVRQILSGLILLALAAIYARAAAAD